MNQEEKRSYLIEKLVAERPEFDKLQIPTDEMEQRTLLRSLMNLRLPAPMDETFLRIQDDYLKRLLKDKGVVEIKDMDELAQNVFVWKGDITRLHVGAIVNAANSGMTGCYQPCHNCIDNCIHTYAGIQLRLKCAEIMEEQGYEEPTGQAKITPAYNLPCDYVIHTVGPIVRGVLTEAHERQLASCYWNCLKIADENNVESIAFCCISTGVFMFPNARAAEIAVDTLEKYREKTGSSIKVVFNVFKDEDERLYKEILCHH
jgi:O-acetyl-ADP-ribose deacetylase (regulator of RNase III)